MSVASRVVRVVSPSTHDCQFRWMISNSLAHLSYRVKTSHGLSKVSKNPFVKERCPNCDSFLKICIVPWPDQSKKVDVHLICDECNSRNVITKNITEKD